MGNKTYSAEIKAKAVLELMKEEKTASELATEYGTSAKQLYNWRKEFKENAYKVFSQSKMEKEAKEKKKQMQEREEELMAKVGKLTIENDWLKKNLEKSLEQAGKIKLCNEDDVLSIKRQCELLGINRTSFYYRAEAASIKEIEIEEKIKNRIDFWHTKMCYLGTRRLVTKLREDGFDIGRKLVRRYMREMNIYCVYPKPNLSKANKQHKKFPYLLRNLPISRPNQVWALDITYITMGKGHMYLTAIIDWYSRFIVGWALSDTLETAPVLEAVKKAIVTYGKPEIINSDQGSQFTSDDYIELLESLDIKQSMDGKARWVDNVIIERWFRSLKCGNIYINEYLTIKQLRTGIREYINEYNTQRPHENLNNNYPIIIYNSKIA